VFLQQLSNVKSVFSGSNTSKTVFRGSKSIQGRMYSGVPSVFGANVFMGTKCIQGLIYSGVLSVFGGSCIHGF